MEKALVLKAETREQAGTHSAKKIRQQGRIPAVVYGHKQEPVTISVDAHDMIAALQSRRRVVEVQIGKKKETMIFKDMQYDYLGKEVIHVDLMRVSATEMVKVEVPIELRGVPKGILEGGIIVKHLDRLEIGCIVTDIPERVVVSVKDIGVGDNLHARDIELGEGVKLITDPEALIVTCSVVAAAKSTEEIEEAAPATPEVIGEAKKTEEEAK